MTDSHTAPVVDKPAVDRCQTCDHPLVSHDALGLRWCMATRLGVGSRDCLCSGAAHKEWGLSHY